MYALFFSINITAHGRSYNTLQSWDLPQYFFLQLTPNSKIKNKTNAKIIINIQKEKLPRPAKFTQMIV